MAAGLALSALAGCGERPVPRVRAPSTPVDEAARSPRIYSGPLEVRWRVGTAGDSMFTFPLLLAADASGAYVFDAAQAVIAFDSLGGRRWSAGRRGGGPLEFRGARDLEIVPGGVAVFDPPNGRITLLNSDGSLRRTVPLAGVPTSQQFVPRSDGGFILVSDNEGTAPISYVDAAGAFERSEGIPWPDYAGLPPLARQGTTATEVDGKWTYGFRLGDGWFAASDGLSLGARRSYAEGTPFPAVLQEVGNQGPVAEQLGRAVVSGMSLAVAEGQVFVLFGGTGEDAFRLIDVFDFSSGAYRHTWRLPEPVDAIAVHGQALYALTTDPVPALIAFSFPTGPRSGL